MNKKFNQEGWNAAAVIPVVILSLYALIRGILMIVSIIARGGGR